VWGVGGGKGVGGGGVEKLGGVNLLTDFLYSSLHFRPTF
jgi:hypothetical protein